MAKVKVCQFNEVPEGDMKMYRVGETQVAVYKLSGQIYATTNICPHEDCRLDENHQMHNDIVECTCHGSQFDVKTGGVIVPPAVEGLKTYRVELAGDDISVEV